ncbi:unnamed protein product, partial [Tilletia laevis]
FDALGIHDVLGQRSTDLIDDAILFVPGKSRAGVVDVGIGFVNIESKRESCWRGERGGNPKTSEVE